MKNMNSKNNKINIIFSSFLVIGYIVCTYFFSSLASQVSGFLGGLIQALMLIVFGLLLFYATRVGEGKQVRRFSLAVLLLVVLPTLFIILAGLITGFPLHDFISPMNAATLMGGLGAPSIIFSMACVAFGYGIPYTFFSGYEMKEEGDETEEEIKEKIEMLEGGLAEELAETEAEEKSGDDEVTEVVEEEILVINDGEKTEIVEEETVTEIVTDEKDEAEKTEAADEAEKTEE